MTINGNSTESGATTGDNSLRRRRADTADDDAPREADAGAPVPKKPKRETDGDDDNDVIESSESNMAENTSVEADDDEEEEQEDDDDDGDMDMASTQPITILPTDDEDNDSNDSEIVEVPQTPPSVQLTAAAMARHGLANRASPRAVRIDARSSARPHLSAASSGSETLVFRHKFALLSDKARLFSPIQQDASGQSWRVVWYPHGLYLDDKFVSVNVEMVVDDESSTEPNLSNAHSETVVDVTPRRVVLEFSLVPPREPNARKYTTTMPQAVLFDANNLDHGVQELVQRARLMSPSESLLNAVGDVDVEVRLQFVDEENGDAVVDLDALSAIDSNEDLVGGAGDTTPVLTPTAASLAIGTPTGRDLMMYDSKSETGMVGLKNQGATCYMNSLLQTLFHLLAFRFAVYETPTEQEDTNDSVSLALQRVFYRLQTQRKAVSTKELTRSFGWSQMDAFMQHDVQELYRILCDRLEEKMKNTKMDNAIKKLFEGKVRSFVQCVNVDFQSFRDESFYDLQLDVKGCKDIYESFRKYVEIEMLNGDNQYEAEGHGKQDAKKGVKFVQFPPVLNIQLKRFEYDPMRDGMVKVHDRFEFPKTLVLDEFAPKESRENKRLVYHLHSVLVHSGDVHGGHYYVFIRPGKDIANSNEWFKFDDDQISRTDERTAIEGNYGSVSSFGGGVSSPSTPLYSSILSPELAPQDSNGTDVSMDFRPLAEDANGLNIGDGDDTTNDSAAATTTSNSMMLPLGRSFSSAYMLVYVRDGDNGVETIQPEVSKESTPTKGNADEVVAKEEAARDEDSKMSDESSPDGVVPVPEPLLQRFHEEEKVTARRKKQQQTEHLFMTFRIAADSSITKLKRITKTIDFSSFGPNGTIRIRIKRAATVQQLYTRIYRRTGVPVAQQRLWKVITRENRTHRPDAPLTQEMLSSRVDGLIDDDSSAKTPVRLYLQIIDEPAEVPTTVTPIYRHFWDEFTPPEEAEAVVTGEGDAPAPEPAPEEDDEDLLDDGVVNGVPAASVPNVGPTEILLFIKFYDVKKALTERLEYMGNVLFDSRKTGASLAKYLHAALNIPISTELILYEEIQPASVNEIEMDSTLDASEIQNGDIICYQYAEDEEIARTQRINGDEQNPVAERYPDVPSYFQYLLDRVDVQFCRYGFPDEDPIIVHLLYSNTYDEIVDSLAHQLGIPEEKRLYLRLYQHSPLNQQPKKHPLRHSKYAGDRQTTLEDFLTEYSERTTTMHFEVLANPITEIESKKQVVVYFSIYDECFVDASAPSIPRRVEFLVSPSETLNGLLKQIAEVFELDASTKLRACEVTHNGSLVGDIVEADPPLDNYWTSAGYTTANDVALFVETVSDEEQRFVAEAASSDVTMADEDDSEENRLFHLGVVHFSFQSVGQNWIHPHGVPSIVYFREQETIGEVKERIRRRIGVNEEVFSKWALAVVKDTKASLAHSLFDDMEPEVVDGFPMTKLQDLCGSNFEIITSLGLEHADPRPASAPKYVRRQEQGIKIRQS